MENVSWGAHAEMGQLQLREVKVTILSGQVFVNLLQRGEAHLLPVWVEAVLALPAGLGLPCTLCRSCSLLCSRPLAHTCDGRAGKKEVGVVASKSWTEALGHAPPIGNPSAWATKTTVITAKHNGRSAIQADKLSQLEGGKLPPPTGPGLPTAPGRWRSQ